MSSDGAITARPIGPSFCVRVVIVDDHPIVAEGLSRIVAAEEDLEFVGLATTVAEALALIGATMPDVVVMDYHLPDGDGGEAALQIRDRWPATKVLMLSGSAGGDLFARAIESGCSGFLSKNRPWIDIVAAIRSVAKGELVIQPGELAGLIGKLRGEVAGEGLSPRELSVLRLLAKGRSATTIAGELFLSVHTVRNHVRSILLKLDAHSMLAAVATAARDGILGLDEIG